jgi:hypothetical protein
VFLAVGRQGAPGGWSAGQGADLDEVVCEDSVSGPDPGSFGGVDHGAVPSVAAFEVADAAFAAGSPFHLPPERSLSFLGLSGLAGFAPARNDDVSDTEIVQVIVDACLAVAAVGGHRSRLPSGAADDAFDSGFQPRSIDRVARLHVVVEDDAVVVVDCPANPRRRWRGNTPRLFQGEVIREECLMINVSSLVEPLGSFPILPYLIQALRAVIREELSEDDQDNLDIWLAPMGHNEVNSHRRVRLVFMAGDRELCRIPYRVVLHAEASFLSRAN